MVSKWATGLKPPSQSQRFDRSGMTLLETLIAVLMVVVFTGVVVMVMEFTFRFLGEAESGSPDDDDVSNGVLIDHQVIQLAMDQLVEVLAQPGLSKKRLDGEEKGFAQIAFELSTPPQEACSSADPVGQWGLRMPKITLPPGYRLCLWRTSAVESPMATLLADAEGAKPGIYVLQALPERLSAKE